MLKTDISKKTENISSAIYLVTSFFNDQEPLKWRLRTLSIDLVSEKIKDKSSISREVLSLLFVAKTAGLVSETNYDILNRELSKFGQEAEKPLDLTFFRETTTGERTLPQPQRTEHIKDKTVENKIAEKPILKEFGAVSVKKNSRQSIIIAILKRKKEVMIKDVSPLVSGCSEKTIQRELSAMVHSGLLRRVGEKRWSRYSLAPTPISH